jgi:hypothetical protein
MAEKASANTRQYLEKMRSRWNNRAKRPFTATAPPAIPLADSGDAADLSTFTGESRIYRCRRVSSHAQEPKPAVPHEQLTDVVNEP